MASDDFDPYAVLGLEPSAPPALLEAGYVQMRLRHRHDPDKLAEIEVAYRMLIDPAERQAYAERRAARLPPIEPEPSADIGALVAEVQSPDLGSTVSTTVPRVPWNYWDMAKAIGTAILIGVAGALVFGAIALLVTSGDDIEEDPEGLAVAFLGSAVLQLGLLFAALRFGLRKYGVEKSVIGLRKPIRGGWLIGPALVAAALVVVLAYGVFLQLIEVSPDTDFPERSDNALPFASLFLTAVLMAPFIEEIFFRGFIFGGLRARWGFFPAALAGGAVFGLAHILNPGFYWIVPPILGIGIVFSWGYEYSGSLYPSMFAHFVYNLIQLVVLLATT